MTRSPMRVPPPGTDAPVRVPELERQRETLGLLHCALAYADAHRGTLLFLDQGWDLLVAALRQA